MDKIKTTGMYRYGEFAEKVAARGRGFKSLETGVRLPGISRDLRRVFAHKWRQKDKMHRLVSHDASRVACQVAAECKDHVRQKTAARQQAHRHSRLDRQRQSRRIGKRVDRQLTRLFDILNSPSDHGQAWTCTLDVFDKPTSDRSIHAFRRVADLRVRHLCALMDRNLLFPVACHLPVGSDAQGFGTEIDWPCKQKGTDALWPINIKCCARPTYTKHSGRGLLPPWQDIEDSDYHLHQITSLIEGVLFQCTYAQHGNVRPALVVLDQQGASLLPLEPWVIRDQQALWDWFCEHR